MQRVLKVPPSLNKTFNTTVAYFSLMDCPFKADIEKFNPCTKPWKNFGPYRLIKSEQEYEAAVAANEPVVFHFSKKKQSSMFGK